MYLDKVLPVALSLKSGKCSGKCPFLEGKWQAFEVE